MAEETGPPPSKAQVEYRKLREKREAQENEEISNRKADVNGLWNHHTKCTRAVYGGRSPRFLYDQSHYYLNMDKHAGSPRASASTSTG